VPQCPHSARITIQIPIQASCFDPSKNSGPKPSGPGPIEPEAMAADKVQAKIKRGMLKIRQNSLARIGAQIGGGQGEVQGRLVAIYLSAKTVTFPLLLRIG
jgi:hypothetical protein